MKTARENLEEIKVMMSGLKNESGNEAARMMLPQIAAIMVILSEEMVKANRRMLWYSIGTFALTFMLVLLTVMMLSC